MTGLTPVTKSIMKDKQTAKADGMTNYQVLHAIPLFISELYNHVHTSQFEWAIGKPWGQGAIVEK